MSIVDRYRLCRALVGATSEFVAVDVFQEIMSTSSGPTVLLVEDSQDDAYFFRRALKKCGAACHVHHLWDGGAAIDLLKQVQAGSARMPDLMFLDLKMPVMTGFEVLEWIQTQGFARPLPVIVLSGSDQQSDQQRARQLGAAEFLVKPITAACLAERLGRLPKSE